jgi:cytochrome c biogenesis protein CcmG, thiol:disulfide interchange protein DsbE
MYSLTSFFRTRKAAKALRTMGMIAIAGAAMYAFSPALQNQFGSVKPAGERVAPAGDLRVATLDAHTWSLADHKGKVILLNFWATWCPPCRVETPSLVSLHNRYSARGFTVAGISLDEDPHSAVPEFVRSHSIPYPILVPSSDFPMLNTVDSLPTSVLIDRSGRVARTYRGLVTEVGLRDDIEALLSEQIEAR